jgi:hypothetical protein
LGFLYTELPGILAQCSDVLLLRMIRVIQDRAWDWRRLDELHRKLIDRQHKVGAARACVPASEDGARH